MKQRQEGAGKRTPGRPSSYRDEYAEQAKKLCQLGATDVDLADFFGVSDRTIYRWQVQFPEFCQALKAGKDLADERVERSLYHRAVGYTFDSEKVFQYQGAIVRAKIREHLPPDTTACIVWLKNRRRQEWTDRHVVEHAGEFDGLTIEQKRERALGLARELGLDRIGPTAGSA